MDIQTTTLLILLLTAIYAAFFIITIRKYKKEIASLTSVNSIHIETIIKICESLNLDSSDPNNSKILEVINSVQKQNQELNIKNTALENALDIAQELAREEGISEYSEVLSELKKKVAQGQTLTLQDREKLFRKRIREKRDFKKTYNAFQKSGSEEKKQNE